MVFERVDHIGVLVDDYQMALEFFGSLGLQLDREAFHEPSNRRTALFDCGNTFVEVIEDLDPQSKAKNLRGQRARIDHIAFDVGDLEPLIEGLARLGLEPDGEGVNSSPERVSYFSEPTGFDGLSLQLLSYRREDV